MIAHLSAQQWSEYVLGRPEPAIERHVQGCSVCQAELDQFRETLGEFRCAVRAWSAEQAMAAVAAADYAPEPRSWSAARQLAWALAIAAVCVIASFVVPGHTEESAARDAVLLNRVDAEVSRSVPSSMEPLLKLVVVKQ
jgi:hypothetical protein